MKKTYKINNVEVNADQIRAIIKDNPELLEEKKGGRYFFPKEGDNGYYYINAGGEVYNLVSNDHHLTGNKTVSMGVFQNKEQAELARDKQKAIVACWKWQQENAPFEPDWSNDEQTKYYAIYNHDIRAYIVGDSYCVQHQFTLPYFKSKEDCEAFIEANKAHLELLFTR